MLDIYKITLRKELHMKITIFELNGLTYEMINGYLPNGWCERVDNEDVTTVNVRISDRTKLITAGNGVILEFMGLSILLDRDNYYYIQIK